MILLFGDFFVIEINQIEYNILNGMSYCRMFYLVKENNEDGKSWIISEWVHCKEGKDSDIYSP